MLAHKTTASIRWMHIISTMVMACITAITLMALFTHVIPAQCQPPQRRGAGIHAAKK
ncbi:MAG: hypothetical protein K2Q13_07105 [Nitrosomonas sp.]|uniref:hypothetical protein n=1 Tax=Nitrosomonas sp. TaxID=42353 RepID=UPI0025D93FE7|nr:hypothetical protein [Nitrosomonas sp.]MBY0474812.1 hypothetical protein [Nitrosomonas sp.]